MPFLHRSGRRAGLPNERPSRDGQLMAYRHTDFWQRMDTLRNMSLLE
jgi:glucose-1-phosphate cytidylyltransferase